MISKGDKVFSDSAWVSLEFCVVELTLLPDSLRVNGILMVSTLFSCNWLWVFSLSDLVVSDFSVSSI